MRAETRTSWQDIRDAIQGRILDRTYRPGDRLPRDEDLAVQLGCSRATVQRAMRDLADRGAVHRRRKGGTEVRSDPVTRATLDIPITRLEVEGKGSAHGYQLVRSATEIPPPAVLARLGLTAPRQLLHVEALHLSDHRPYIFEDRWISIEAAPEILEIDLKNQSANEWLVMNKPFSRCDVRFHAVSADARLAEILSCADRDALFVMERTTWLDAQPITTVSATAAPGYQLLTQISK